MSGHGYNDSAANYEYDKYYTYKYQTHLIFMLSLCCSLFQKLKSQNKHCEVHFGHQIFEDSDLLGCDTVS